MVINSSLKFFFINKRFIILVCFIIFQKVSRTKYVLHNTGFYNTSFKSPHFEEYFKILMNFGLYFVTKKTHNKFLIN